MQRFLLVWLLGLIGFLGIAVGLNLAVDPYGIIDSPRLDGFNRYKVVAVDWPRVTKPYLILGREPSTVVLGSSPADVGIDPSSPVWPLDLKPVFNMAIDGSSPYAQYRFEQHALEVSKPKLVILCLTLEDSLRFEDPLLPSNQPSPVNDFDGRLKVTITGAPNPDYRTGRFKDYLFALGSFRAVGDSLLTILGQSDAIKTFQTPLGFLNGGKFQVWAKTEGFNSLVTDKDSRYVGIYLRWAKNAYFDIEPLAKMIALARDHGAEVDVAILPNYADQMEIRRQAGVTNRFDAWKTRVTELVDQANRTSGQVTLWDFNAFSQYTTQPLPGPDERASKFRWFWESVHFQPELGSLLVERILGHGPADLGEILTPANLEANISAFHNAQEKWVAEHTNDVARIARMIAENQCQNSLSTCSNGSLAPVTPNAGASIVGN